jgi:hypothetical protein
MSGGIVCRVLDRMLSDNSGPRSITVDHGAVPIAGHGKLGLSVGRPARLHSTGEPGKMPSLNHLMGVFAMCFERARKGSTSISFMQGNCRDASFVEKAYIILYILMSDMCDVSLHTSAPPSFYSIRGFIKIGT